jgi:Fe2+ or Zn2+ uptake regulation protein
VPYAVPPRTLKALAQRHGFKVESERVTFEGRCVACNNN